LDKVIDAGKSLQMHIFEKGIKTIMSDCLPGPLSITTATACGVSSILKISLACQQVQHQAAPLDRDGLTSDQSGYK
jgi:hypothetical protein